MVPSGNDLGVWPRHRRTVEDVMATSVVTADQLTPYKEIARLLAEHQISGLPVLVDGWQVVGVVSETDLLAAQDKAARLARTKPGRRLWQVREPRQSSLIAGELMTAPPILIRPDATIAAAVRTMTKYHVRRLPVTGADRQLIGIVSRRDVLSLFLRPDTDIARDVRQVLGELPLADPESVIVTVRHGVVTIAGTIEPAAGEPHGARRARELIPPRTVRLIGDLDGVVEVVTRLSRADR